MANTYYTVKKGDTLSSIASKYSTTTAKLKKLNDLESNKIAVGEKLLVKGTVPSSSKKTSSSNKCKVKQFGLQSDTDRTVFATWSWGKSNRDYYVVHWYYRTGDNVWFLGLDSHVNERQSVYNAPSNALGVKFSVKAVSKKHKVNGKETSYWTGAWSTAKKYSFSNNPPETPSSPSVTVDNLRMLAELNNVPSGAKKIQFQVVKDNTSIYKTWKDTITKSYASFSFSVAAGHEYKVRCRAIDGSDYSDWSEYTQNYKTIPTTPKSITKVSALTKTSIKIEWASVSSAESYTVQYTTDKNLFDSGQVSSVTVQAPTHHAEILGLATGERYFFRVCATNGQGNSGWTSIQHIVLGEPPGAPTSWSSTTAAKLGEPIRLWWMHNSKDGSSEVRALVRVHDGEKYLQWTVEHPQTEEEKDKPGYLDLDVAEWPNGASLTWVVKTMGITSEYGEFSVARKIDIYQEPSLELILEDKEGEQIDTITEFPFVVRGNATPLEQTPMGYFLSIIANESYVTVDNMGNEVTINANDPVYSNYIDSHEPLEVTFDPSKVNLENDISYTIQCTVSMDSGLTAETTLDFEVAWQDEEYSPNAEISIDKDTLTANIKPYCDRYPMIYYEVIIEEGAYIRTPNILEPLEGESVEDAYTMEDDMVFSAIVEEETIYFCMRESEEPELVEDISLSVYRREYDGSFIEIGSGLENLRETVVLDPHPALDMARYRVIAVSDITGSISYYDVPGYPVEEKSVVIQWDEEWSDFNATSEDPAETPPWSGSLLKLPYNIDVSDDRNLDVELVKYAGRKRPVSYYGTHLGETSVWNMDIVKSDIDTLYALRRLSIYMGDVYVREPSGSGYWASIKVSFSQKHTNLVIPVTLNITRVEGGV